MTFYGWLSSCVCWCLSVVSRSAHDAPLHTGAAKCCLQKFGIFQEVKEKALHLFSWMSRISKHLQINLIFLQKLLWNACLHLNINIQCVQFGEGMEFNFPNCVMCYHLKLQIVVSNQTSAQERASQVVLFVLRFQLADVGEGETRGIHLVIICNYTVADATESYAALGL